MLIWHLVFFHFVSFIQFYYVLNREPLAIIFWILFLIGGVYFLGWWSLVTWLAGTMLGSRLAFMYIAKNRIEDDSSHPVARFVAWAPKGYSAPIELTAVRLLPGQVTERQWWEALADRVAELAMNEGEEVVAQACRLLDVPMTNRIEEVGQSLVLYNSRLKTALNLAAYEGIPFPAIVNEPSQEAEDALEVTLLEWVDHALSTVSESSLD